PVVIVNVRRSFRDPQVAAPLDRHRRVVIGLILLHAPVRHEEPQLVPYDWTAERQIWLIVLAPVRRNPLDVRAVERLRDDEERRRSVKHVAAALRHDVSRWARGPEWFLLSDPSKFSCRTSRPAWPLCKPRNAKIRVAPWHWVPCGSAGSRANCSCAKDLHLQ